MDTLTAHFFNLITVKNIGFSFSIMLSFRCRHENMLMYSNIWKRGGAWKGAWEGAWEGAGPAGNLNSYKPIGLHKSEKTPSESLQIAPLLATPFLDPFIPFSLPSFFYIFLLF